MGLILTPRADLNPAGCLLGGKAVGLFACLPVGLFACLLACMLFVCLLACCLFLVQPGNRFVSCVRARRSCVRARDDVASVVVVLFSNGDSY